MEVSEKRLLKAISDMIDEKFDVRLAHIPTKDELDARLSEMPTKAELDARLSEMPTKAELDARLSEMPTNKVLENSLRNLEISLLEELDIVQEKANNHFEKLERRMDSLELTVNMIKVEYSSINLLVRKYTELDARVTGLEQKIS